MRKACLEQVYQLAKKDERVVFVGSDLGAGTLSHFQEEMPERFYGRYCRSARSGNGLRSGPRGQGCLREYHPEFPDPALLRAIAARYLPAQFKCALHRKWRRIGLCPARPHPLGHRGYFHPAGYAQPDDPFPRRMQKKWTVSCRTHWIIKAPSSSVWLRVTTP